MASDGSVPFDADGLRELCAHESVDALLVTSPHGIQHLLGGYRRFFFAADDRLGLDRSMSVLLCPLDQLDASHYTGHPLESSQLAAEPIWVDHVDLTAWSAPQAVASAAAQIGKLNLRGARIGIEPAFLGLDAFRELERLCPQIEIVDASTLLEDSRAVKQPYELELMRAACDRVIEAMGTVFEGLETGAAADAVEQAVREEEAALGLDFVYAQVIFGADASRFPDPQRRLGEGQALALDSGGAFRGYLGDLTRMAIVGHPSDRQFELLEEVGTVQRAAIDAIGPGVPGSEVRRAAQGAIAESAHRSAFEFIAEGTGLVGHEAPRLGPSPLRGAARHDQQVLRAGMVIGVETTLTDPEVGLVKLEDMVAVGESGSEVFGDRHRGWNGPGRGSR